MITQRYVLATLCAFMLASMAAATNTTCTDPGCPKEGGVETWVALLIVGGVLLVLAGMAYILYKHHIRHRNSHHNAKHHMLTHHGQQKAHRGSIAEASEDQYHVPAAGESAGTGSGNPKSNQVAPA